MNSLNFDYDTLSTAIKMWGILSIWSKKIKDIKVPGFLLEVEYNYYDDNEKLCSLLVYLFRQTLIEESELELNEENCKIADILLEFNDDIYEYMYDTDIECPDRESCMEYNKSGLGCHDCKYFNETLHDRYDFYKISLKSSLFKNNSHLNVCTLEILSELYFSQYNDSTDMYIGHIYNKEEGILEILYFSDFCSMDNELLSNYSLHDILEFFRDALDDL